MSKDELRCDSLQFSLHNLQIPLSLCNRVHVKSEGTFLLTDSKIIFSLDLTKELGETE